jgi:hypothetical protein
MAEQRRRFAEHEAADGTRFWTVSAPRWQLMAGLIGSILALALTVSGLIVGFTKPFLYTEIDGRVAPTISILKASDADLARQTAELAADVIHRAEFDAYVRRAETERQELLSVLNRLDERIEYLYRNEIGKRRGGG